MKIPSEVLTYLLKGGHMSVEERKNIGLWPSETLRFDDLVEHLVRILEKDEWFPGNFQEQNTGDPMREGIYIQRIGPEKFTCYAIRLDVHDTKSTAERTETEFTSAREAVCYYLKWELHLPGRLDGWLVNE